MLKRLKKGFTLAELLIVVAIIAVLTAIAVPLFVTGINNAKESTKEANVRVVRVAATYEILQNQDTYYNEKYQTITNTKGTLAYDQEADAANEYAWYVTADITKSGDLTNLKVYDTAAKAKTAGYGDLANGKEYVIDSGSDDIAYKVVVLLTETTMAEATA